MARARDVFPSRDPLLQRVATSRKNVIARTRGGARRGSFIRRRARARASASERAVKYLCPPLDSKFARIRISSVAPRRGARWSRLSKEKGNRRDAARSDSGGVGGGSDGMLAKKALGYYFLTE